MLDNPDRGSLFECKHLWMNGCPTNREVHGKGTTDLWPVSSFPRVFWVINGHISPTISRTKSSSSPWWTLKVKSWPEVNSAKSFRAQRSIARWIFRITWVTLNPLIGISYDTIPCLRTQNSIHRDYIFYIQIASDVLHRYFSHFRFHKFVYPFQSAINFKFSGHEKVHTDLYKSFQIYFNIKNELYILFISFYANQCFTKLVPRIRSVSYTHLTLPTNREV